MTRANLRLKRPSSQTRLLSRVALWDVSWGGASPFLAYLVRDGSIQSIHAVAIYCGIALFVSLFVFQWLRTHTPIAGYFSIRDAFDLLKACALIVALSATLAFLATRLDEAPRSVPVLHFVLLAFGLSATRLFSRMHAMRRESSMQMPTKPVQHILLIRACRLAWFFTKLVEELAPGEYQIVAILDERPKLQHRSLNGYPIIGSPADIESIVDEYGVHGIRIDKVIVAARPEDVSKPALEAVYRLCGNRQIELEVLADRLIPCLSAIRYSPAEPPILEPTCNTSVSTADCLDTLLTRRFWKAKRLLDFIVALGIGVATVPVAAAVVMLALLDVGIPVIFWQRRVGRHGAPLYLYKFRTLQSLVDRRTKDRRQVQHPSTIGRFLRKTRLDELPQLWNVLRGDMSLIGPRPLLPADQPNQRTIRLMVRPGLSGWAQICGGKLISPEEKDALDEWYIRHASLWLDAVIVLRTIRMALMGDRRDERAISMALGEKLQGEMLGLLDSVASDGKRRQRHFPKHTEVAHATGAIGLGPTKHAVPAQSARAGPAGILKKRSGSAAV